MIGGKHADVACKKCHVSQEYKGAAKECVGCHRKDDQDKGHKGGVTGSAVQKKLAVTCVGCHSKNDQEKGLQGMPSCREGTLWAEIRTTCISCHKKDDKHKNQLGNKCETCHKETRWQDAPYDHNKSRFPLTGSHVKVECKKCHQTPAFHDALSSCKACHEKDDKHKGRFGSKCEACHYTGTWMSWDFDHNTTRFALDGAHKKVACFDCHKEPTSSQDIRAGYVSAAT